MTSRPSTSSACRSPFPPRPPSRWSTLPASRSPRRCASYPRAPLPFTHNHSLYFPLGPPYATLTAFALALAAQRTLEPIPDRSWHVAAVLYGMAALALVFAYVRKEWVPAQLPLPALREDPLTIRPVPLVAGAVLLILAYLFFSQGPAAAPAWEFTRLNVLCWVGGTALLAYGFWLPDPYAEPWSAKLRRVVLPLELASHLHRLDSARAGSRWAVDLFPRLPHRAMCRLRWSATTPKSCLMCTTCCTGTPPFSSRATPAASSSRCT